MTQAIARRLGQALNIKSASRLKVIDESLRQYGREVPQAATVEMTGAIDAGQVTSGTFNDTRIAASNVTQHQTALAIATSQVTSGTFANARIAASNVTQHQAALSLAATQIHGANALGDYANDGAAAAGGVIVGDLYRNGSVLMVRVA